MNAILDLDITPLHHESRNCKEDTIVTVASWWKCDYELMFLESWGFTFDLSQWKNSGRLYQSITSGIGDMLTLLKQVHGIEIVVMGNKSLQDTVAIVESELKESRPVAFDLDSYYCQWSHGYQKYHSIHTGLIVGVDPENHCYTLVDCFYEKKNVTIPIEHCFKHEYRGIALFRKLPNAIEGVEWKQLIMQALSRTLFQNQETNSFDMMRSFAEVLEHLPTVEDEFNGSKEVWMSPLLTVLYSISNGRKHFSTALQYVKTKYQVDDLVPLINDLAYAAAQWSTILSMITKAYYQSSDSQLIQRAASKIRMVAELEETIAVKLRSICEERPQNNQVDEKAEHGKTATEHRKMKYIDISDYCNNKGFSQLVSPAYRADLTLMGEYFLIDQLPDQTIWDVEGMKFSLSAFGENINDNISCAGQDMKVPEGYYSSIMLLGCSECGSYAERIEILYEDNEVSYIPIQFTDWYLEPIFGETTAWVGKGVQRKGGEVKILEFPVRLLVQKYELNQRKKILRIKLPDCPNIHIFAMTLMAEE
ncbi:hypothetical protein [Brevibacillus formosus]|nr:hypothetical protein [Brevibacillus formosus]